MRGTGIIVLLVAVAMKVMAVPAYRGPIVRTGEDGTERMVYMHGNEHFHYLTDSTGQWLDEKTLRPMTIVEKEAHIKSGAAIRARRVQSIEAAGGQPNLAPRGLVILVNFQDTTFSTPKDTLENMLNGAHFTRDYTYRYKITGRYSRIIHVTSEGSAWQYFYDQSYGTYSPQFDLVGPLMVSQDMAYYGANEQNYNDIRAYEMVYEACQLADQSGVDFRQYDNDGDGKVDFVYIIYAGYGEADGGGANTIWPHKSDLSWAQLRLDGKYISTYACGCEMNNVSKVYDGIGTFCHEFSHVLGLPDLYETNETSKNLHTPLNWDVMDYGTYLNDGNTPPAYSAYERFYMGWLTPRILNKPEYVTLRPLDEGEALLISTTSTHNMNGWNPNPKQFYLLEARQKTGWDSYIPGGGMLITQINYNSSKWQNNTVNNSTPMGVDILEATANTGALGAATDAYPAGATEWTDVSGKEITTITRNEEDGTISFSFRGAQKPEGIENSYKEGKHREGLKILHNGQVVILRNGRVYNLTGTRLEDYENHQL